MDCEQAILKMLKNSHLMEKSLSKYFSEAADDAEDMPEVAEIYRDWAETATRHEQKLEEKITGMGGDVSGVGEWLSEKAGALNMGEKAFPDKNIKNAVASVGAGYLAKAGYMATRELVKECGEEEQLSMDAEEFGKECAEYADKIKEKIPEIVKYAVEKE